MKKFFSRFAPEFLRAMLACVSIIWIFSVKGAQAQVVFSYPPSQAAGNCAALRLTDFLQIPDAPAQVTSSQTVPATSGLPAYCDVQGYTGQTVRFDLQLPDASNWNGKFFMQGCGGYCGAVNAGDAIGLGLGPVRGTAQGYASASTDTGHQGATSDGLWAFHNPQAQIYYGHLGIHMATLATRAITEAYYGKKVRFSYFVGESSGGGMAMMEAERYPADFDGIVAQQPTLNTPGFAVLGWNWMYEWFYDRHTGEPIFNTADVENIHNAVLSACDALDGTRDGIIDDPEKCHFDPAKLKCPTSATSWCLSDQQVTALQNVYQGAHTSSGKQLFPGLEFGSELAWVGAAYLPSSPGTIPLIGALTDASFQFIAFDPPFGIGYNPRTFNYDTDTPKLAKLNSIYDASTPDLKGFAAHGSKLLVTAGWGDQLVLPKTTLNYYKGLVTSFGGPEKIAPFFRLFMIPAMNHGPTSMPPDPPARYDPLAIISGWVEQGVAPDSLVVSHVNAQGQADKTRTLYPYPKEPEGYKEQLAN